MNKEKWSMKINKQQSKFILDGIVSDELTSNVISQVSLMMLRMRIKDVRFEVDELMITYVEIVTREDGDSLIVYYQYPNEILGTTFTQRELPMNEEFGSRSEESIRGDKYGN